MPLSRLVALARPHPDPARLHPAIWRAGTRSPARPAPGIWSACTPGT
jgi:hypothetical protein